MDLAGWLFAARTFLIRRAFRMGRASYLEGEIRGARNEACASRLYSHYRLATGSLSKGQEGWRRFEERAKGGGFDLFATLRCGPCRHLYVVRVPRAADPLSLPRPPGETFGYPASFHSDWFRFWHPDCPGEPALDCRQCEQKSTPKVRLL